MTELIPTPASYWRDAYDNGKIVQLPSGAVVRLRPCYITHFARSGSIPDALLALTAQTVTDTKSGNRDEESERQRQVKIMVENTELAYRLCKMMFVYPRVVDQPSADDEISFDMIDPVDATYIVSLFNKPVEELRSFRHEQAADVAGVGVTAGDEPSGE